eukprot:gb/GECG01004936.1/.p1 GENE.gb/GECG01004936.1/~~gb/GECG01004936.1/.p1  ORF type:complete len:109 (+),score=13.88 gb/GECG01004936.1/:1-327(+)
MAAGSSCVHQAGKRGECGTLAMPVKTQLNKALISFAETNRGGVGLAKIADMLRARALEASLGPQDLTMPYLDTVDVFVNAAYAADNLPEDQRNLQRGFEKGIELSSGK